MAPKKKSKVMGSSSTAASSMGTRQNTSSRDVTDTTSTEDSNLGFRGNKFTSPEAQAEFLRLMEKAVAKERGFLPTCQHGDLVMMIQEKGWQTICEAPAAVPLSIVREFYANAKADKNGYSVVRGLTVDYQASAIRGILNQPEMPEGAEDWVLKTREEVDLDQIVERLCVPGTVWKCKPGTTEQVTFPATTMNRYARAWNLFISANLLPSSHYHEVTVEHAILLWGILNGQYVDVGYLIHQNMIRFLRGGTTGAIPHASIVARLCEAVHVRWASDEQLQMPASPIDQHTIQRMVEWSGGVPHPRGLGYSIGGSSRLRPHRPGLQQRAERQGSDQHMGAASGLADAQYRRLLRRFDVSHDINHHFAEDLTHALDGIYQQQGIQITWPTYGAHTIYPPPDTPPEEGEDSDE